MKLDDQGIPRAENTEKGNIWKVNYHYSMFFTEALRLAEQYPDQVKQLNATYKP